jgi:hypothetical protein
MIRRDYVMRLVQEMAQILATVRSLKQRREFEQAIAEVDGALRQVGDVGANVLSLEEWISACRKHDQAAPGLMISIADLFNEQSEILALQNTAAGQPRALALGLYLEAILDENSSVSLEMVGKAARLVETTATAALPAPVLRRLINYFLARGDFAKAEDALFTWLETRDPQARTAGVTLYDRLLALPADELERGGLPHSEVEQGRSEFDARCRAILNGGE